jgi:hypothetical protein
MRSLQDLVLWIVAVGVALLVARRWRRGRRVLLTGRLTPRLVRMVAIALVALGVGPAGATDPDPCATLPDTREQPQRKAAIDAPLTGELPLGLDQPGEPLTMFGRARGGRGPWTRTKWAMEALTADPANERLQRDAQRALSMLDAGGIANPAWNALGRALEAEIAAWSRDATLPELEALLDTIEAAHIYDGWVVAYLFRRSAPAAGPATLTAAEGAKVARLYARLERQARVDEAYARASVTAGPIEQRPWMSKAAPPKEMMPGVIIPAALGPAMKESYAKAQAGAWRSEALLQLEVASALDGARLLRRGAEVALRAGDRLTLGRLDVVVAPAGEAPLVLRHADLGALTLPPGEALTAWGLEHHLADAAKKQIEQWVAKAEGCDRAAQAALQRTLPASQGALRRAVAATPQTKGAPAMRLLLALFDR